MKPVAVSLTYTEAAAALDSDETSHSIVEKGK
jgi:hypothetical protein